MPTWSHLWQHVGTLDDSQEGALCGSHVGTVRRSHVGTSALASNLNESKSGSLSLSALRRGTSSSALGGNRTKDTAVCQLGKRAFTGSGGFRKKRHFFLCPRLAEFFLIAVGPDVGPAYEGNGLTEAHQKSNCSLQPGGEDLLLPGVRSLPCSSTM